MLTHNHEWWHLHIASVDTLLQVISKCISGKITTVPRLFQEHLLQNENKHQIMNVHTK